MNVDGNRDCACHAMPPLIHSLYEASATFDHDVIKRRGNIGVAVKCPDEEEWFAGGFGKGVGKAVAEIDFAFGS